MKQKLKALTLGLALGMFGFLVIGCEQESYLTDAASNMLIQENDYTFGNEGETHVCIDKFISSERDSLEKAAVVPSRLWSVGQTIRIRFLGGDVFVQDKVMENAKIWEQYANVRFVKVTKGIAEIRIAFDQEDGSWSYIGKDAMYLPQDSASMNFGWFDHKTSSNEFRRTTLHEFGHALGMVHEHQHPVAGIPWDTTRVYAYYTKAPNNWSKEDINRNLFERYNASQTQFCGYDPASIMHYPVSNSLTIGNFQVGLNTNLSSEDQRFMSKMYPFSGRRTPLQCRTAAKQVEPVRAMRYSTEQ